MVDQPGEIGPPVVLAFHEDEHSRRELRQYPNMLVMVYLRRRVGGGWYVRDSIELPTADADPFGSTPTSQSPTSSFDVGSTDE